MTHHTLRTFLRALGQRPFWLAGWNILVRFRGPLRCWTGGYQYQDGIRIQCNESTLAPTPLSVTDMRK